MSEGLRGSSGPARRKCAGHPRWPRRSLRDPLVDELEKGFSGTGSQTNPTKAPPRESSAGSIRGAGEDEPVFVMSGQQRRRAAARDDAQGGFDEILRRPAPAAERREIGAIHVKPPTAHAAAIRRNSWGFFLFGGGFGLDKTPRSRTASPAPRIEQAWSAPVRRTTATLRRASHHRRRLDTHLRGRSRSSRTMKEKVAPLRPGAHSRASGGVRLPTRGAGRSRKAGLDAAGGKAP